MLDLFIHICGWGGDTRAVVPMRFVSVLDFYMALLARWRLWEGTVLAKLPSHCLLS